MDTHGEDIPKVNTNKIEACPPPHRKTTGSLSPLAGRNIIGLKRIIEESQPAARFLWPNTKYDNLLLSLDRSLTGSKPYWAECIVPVGGARYQIIERLT